MSVSGSQMEEMWGFDETGIMCADNSGLIVFDILCTALNSYFCCILMNHPPF